MRVRENPIRRATVERWMFLRPSITRKVRQRLSLPVSQGSNVRIILTCLRESGESLREKFGGALLGIALGGSFARGVGSKERSDVDYVVYVNGRLSSKAEDEIVATIDSKLRQAGYNPCEARHFHDLTREGLRSTLEQIQQGPFDESVACGILSPFSDLLAYGEQPFLRSRCTEALANFAKNNPSEAERVYQTLRRIFPKLLGLDTDYFLEKARVRLGETFLTEEEWAYLDQHPPFSRMVRKKIGQVFKERCIRAGLPEQKEDFIRSFSCDLPSSFSIPFRRITIVCTGNHVRSFMLEAILKGLASQLKSGILEVISIRSAGINLETHQTRLRSEGVSDPSRPHPAALTLLQQRGIDCSGFKKNSLTQEQVDSSDLLLVMTKEQKRLVAEQFSGTAGKLFLVKEFTQSSEGDIEVHVPHEYEEETWDAFEEIADDLLKKLLPDQVFEKPSKIPFLAGVSPDVRARVRDYEWAIPIFSAKGWLSINYFVRCSLGCIYCFASRRFKHAKRKASGRGESHSTPIGFGKPIQLFEEAEVAKYVLNHPYFRAESGIEDGIPLGIHTGTTEAFLPQVKGSTFRLLELLDQAGIRNDVVIITKYFLALGDIQRLEDSLQNIRLNIMVCYAAHPREVEPFSTKIMRQRKLEMIEHIRRSGSDHLRAFHYLRPLAVGWNTDDERLSDVLQFGATAEAIVIGGIALTNLTQQVLDSRAQLPVGPYPGEDRDGWERYGPGKKFMPRDAVVDRVLELRDRLNITTPVVRRSSCAISLGRQVPDYNAHQIDDPERNCLPSCPPEQKQRCASAIAPPSRETVAQALAKMGFPHLPFTVTEMAVRLEIATSSSFSNLDSFALRHLIRFPVKFGKESR